MLGSMLLRGKFSEESGRELPFCELTIKMFVIQRMTPSQPMLKVQSKENLIPFFLKPIQDLALKICLLGCHIGRVNVQAQT